MVYTIPYTPPPPLTVALTSVSSNPVNAAFTVTATFNRPVTGLGLGDFSVTNGTASGLTGSGASYTVTITPVADGAVTVGLPANVAQDTAGTQNTAAADLTRTADITPPSVTLASAAGNPVTGAFPVTITFSESVTGFAADDLSLTNATASDFAGSGASYTVTITPASDGAVTVGVPANVAQDAAGNQNTAAAVLTRNADITPPGVILASASGDPVSGAFPATITFSESVTGFAAGDLSLTNATASNFAGSGASYSVTITPVADGAVTVGVPANVAQDAAGNQNTASNTLTRQADTVRPEVTLASASGDPTNGAFTVTAVFTKPVTGLVLGDFAVTNGSASGLTGSGDSYSVTITPTGDGAVSVSLPDGAATDAAGNTSTASNALSRQIDTARPAVTLASASGDPTNGAFTVTAVFTKPVTGLVQGDFVVTNGTASGLTGSGSSYSVTITPTGDGTVSVSLPDGAATDAAGNASTASNMLTRQIDTARPAVTLAS
ncbi:MAG: beta strand repeat-containing protein, partial [Oceanicaulis sp.]